MFPKVSVLDVPDTPLEKSWYVVVLRAFVLDVAESPLEKSWYVVVPRAFVLDVAESPLEKSWYVVVPRAFVLDVTENPLDALNDKPVNIKEVKTMIFVSFFIINSPFILSFPLVELVLVMRQSGCRRYRKTYYRFF